MKQPADQKTGAAVSHRLSRDFAGLTIDDATSMIAIFCTLQFLLAHNHGLTGLC
jgi:hypothetical protein